MKEFYPYLKIENLIEAVNCINLIFNVDILYIMHAKDTPNNIIQLH